MEMGIVPVEQGIVPVGDGRIQWRKGRLVVYVCVCVCCMLLHVELCINLRGGARGGDLHGDPGRLYGQLGVNGGSPGQVVGQPGVGLIMAFLLDSMTYRDVLW